MKLDPTLATVIGSIIVAVVAGLAGMASQRAANKAALSTSRLDLEREAYERARSYDTETIKRQDTEIDELRARLLEQDKTIRQLREQKDHEVEDLRAQNSDLRRRVFLLERGVGPITINYKEGFDDGPEHVGGDSGELHGGAQKPDAAAD